MARLEEVVAALETIAPTQRAQEWDNVGLLAGDLATGVRRAMLCIDLMPAVVSEAIRQKVQLVVSYHPPIFRPITRLVEPSDRMEAGIHRCIRRGIAVYTPHTALDVARGGTNDVLAEHCGAKATAPLVPDADGIGIGRVGSIAATTLLELARRLKRRTGARCVSVVGEPSRRLKRVICVVGAAGDLPFGVALGRGDAIVTGEIRHHDALRTLRVGASAIALGHWSSERPALAALASRLEAMTGIQASLSNADGEPFLRV